MTELWLKYTDEKGEEIRLPVEREKFSIGRHSENDLSIVNPAISRQHAKIERSGDVFVISDTGSSLGTKINGDELIEPTTLYNGDKINLGDSLEIEVEMIFDNDQNKTAGNDAANSEKSANEDIGTGSFASATTTSSASSGYSIPTSFFYIAPLLGIVVLLTLGGIFLATSGGKGKEAPKGNEFVYSNERRTSTEPMPEVNETASAEETPSPAQTNENTSVNTTDTPTVSTPEENSSQPSPRISGELGKIEINSASFLRRIAQNEPRAFLTGAQQEVVQAKINQFKNSQALADNLKSAKKNAAEIQSLANSKNLKPQFLTVAALARLGNNRGDVLQTAQAMAEILNELARSIGGERSDDALLVIAAYEQGASGNTLGLRNKLQGLDDESSARRIRTIWFLKNSNHITEAEFESALRFLAIGTISQNPKEFGVNAEAVIF